MSGTSCGQGVPVLTPIIPPAMSSQLRDAINTSWRGVGRGHVHLVNMWTDAISRDLPASFLSFAPSFSLKKFTSLIVAEMTEI